MRLIGYFLGIMVPFLINGAQASTPTTPEHRQKAELLYQAPIEEADLVRYTSRTTNATIYLLEDRVVFGIDCPTKEDGQHNVYRFDLVFEGCNEEIVIEQEMLTGAMLIQSDAVNGQVRHRNSPISKGIRYRNIYDGIDLICYSEGDRFKYDFELLPGANPGLIQMRVLSDGDILPDNGLGFETLTLQTEVGEIDLGFPIAIQGKDTLTSAYEMDGNLISFLLGDYDRKRTLIIDPTIAFNTLWGGTGDDVAHGVDHDVDGNTYQVGSTSSNAFPASIGLGTGYSNSHPYASKYDAAGSLLWSILIGGASSNAAAMDVEVDAIGDVYITGYTGAGASFPSTAGTYTGSGIDAFIAKLDPQGTILWSERYGGSDDDFAYGLGLDAVGNPLFTGQTDMGSSPDFPATSYYNSTSTVSSTPPSGYGGMDIFCIKFNSLGTRVWGTQWGNEHEATYSPNPYGEEVAFDVVVNGSGDVFIAGSGSHYTDISDEYHSQFTNVISYGVFLTPPIQSEFDMFLILRLNPLGEYLNLAQFLVEVEEINIGSFFNLNFVYATDLLVTDQDEIIFTGYSNSVNNLYKPWEDWITGEIGNSDMSHVFLIKLAPDLSSIDWATTYTNATTNYSGAERLRSYAIGALDNNEYVIAGSVRTGNWDPPFTNSTWAIPYSAVDDHLDVMLVGFKDYGNVVSNIWGYKIAGIYDDEAFGLSIQDECEITLCGYTNGDISSQTQQLMPSASTTYVVSGLAQEEAFQLTIDCEIPSSGFNGCENCLTSFSPLQSHKYVLSAWVKEEGGASPSMYSAPQIELDFDGAGVLGPFSAAGPIIDGWQQIEIEFVIPGNAAEVDVRLINASASSTVYFDDIRIFPFDANMKSYVYDPVTHRLVAELDENNYAVFYEYDSEGKLVRVKRETERGIQTIQESRSNIAQ